MAQIRVFLSHSSQDKEVAGQMVAALRHAGADVWYDESHLGTGQLLTEITTHLRTRPVFIVLLSPSAFASDWVRDECQWAYQLYRRDSSRIILPVVISPLASNAFDELLFIEGFKRVEVPRHRPYSVDEIIANTVRLIVPTSNNSPPLTSSRQMSDVTKDAAPNQPLGMGSREHLPASHETQLHPSTSPHKIYVSYARSDNAFVHRLCSDLEARGFSVWTDQGDISALPIQDGKVNTGIKGADVVLVVLSPSATKSQWVHMEYVYALRNGKVVIPLLYSPVEIPLRLRPLQVFDFQASFINAEVYNKQRLDTLVEILNHI